MQMHVQTRNVHIKIFNNLHKRPKMTHPMLKAFDKTRFGHLLLRTPDEESYCFGNPKNNPGAYIRLNNWNALDAILTRGEVGCAETYMDGRWETNDLPALLTWVLANTDSLEDYFYGNKLYALWSYIKAMLHANTVNGSKKNILKHYDLGNDFYKLWLDRSMTYSGALFEGDENRSLADAQQAKYCRILKKLSAKRGDHILEIGCGWGGFAQAAAQKGIQVTGITISKEQKTYAEEQIYRYGLEQLVHISLQDYRKITGQFDHIVSIGMFEHVGEKYWPVYFDIIRNHLKPGGKAVIQTITIGQELFNRTHKRSGFIETYIFPGGLLPSKPLFRAAVEQAGLRCQEIFSFGQDYAITTRHWLVNFEAHTKQIIALGYDESFLRMWRFYLSSCIAAFETKRIDVMQAELTHAGGRDLNL